MNRRTLLILASVAVAVAVLALIGQRTERGGTANGGLVGTELVADLAGRLNAIEQVTVVAPGARVAVTLTRSDDGWVVEQQDGYPADVARLREALVALAEATVVEEKTASPDFYSRLGVEPIDLESASGTEVRLAGAGEPAIAVILGSASGPNGRFARLADRPTSVLIDTNPSFPTDPTQWLRPELIDLRSDRIQRIEITHADGERLVIARESRDQSGFGVRDIPPGRELQYASIANVTGNALRELQLEGARSATDTTEVATISEFYAFDGLVVTVTGTADGDGGAWVAFEARFDADQALAFADEAVDEDIGAAGQTDVAAPDSTGAEAQANEINARLGGWQFRIPSHIHDQMTRRMDDLLRTPEAAAE